MSTHNAIASLEEDRSIIPVDVDDVTWYHVPRVQSARLESARESKIPVYRAWTSALQRAGVHAEYLWREAFSNSGWTVGARPIRIRCPVPNDPDADHSTEHEVDVLAMRPPQTARPKESGAYLCRASDWSPTGFFPPGTPGRGRREVAGCF